jgi:O-antigen ligase
MVVGIGPTLYFALSTQRKWLRRLGFAAAALCVGGVVSSFARGAVLSAGIVLFYVWLRWPQKRQATLAMLGIGLVIAIASSLLSGQARGGDDDSPQGFWAEMGTMFDSKGDNGDDRKVLWAAAIKVFHLYPILGAGANNFGPAAAESLRPGEVGGRYADNPATLYDRALHSSYYQILCEQGILGCSIVVLVLVDFKRRCNQMRKPRLREAWAVASRGRTDLYYLSLGLEAGMLGFLGNAFFYNVLTVHWLYTLIAMCMLLHSLASREAKTLAARRPGAGNGPATGDPAPRAPTRLTGSWRLHVPPGAGAARAPSARPA